MFRDKPLYEGCTVDPISRRISCWQFAQFLTFNQVPYTNDLYTNFLTKKNKSPTIVAHVIKWKQPSCNRLNLCSIPLVTLLHCTWIICSYMDRNTVVPPCWHSQSPLDNMYPSTRLIYARQSTATLLILGSHCFTRGMISGPRFNIKMTSYQYRKSHCGDKTILRPSYLHNGISYTGKTTSLYWIGALMTSGHRNSFHITGALWEESPGHDGLPTEGVIEPSLMFSSW